MGAQRPGLLHRPEEEGTPLGRALMWLACLFTLGMVLLVLTLNGRFLLDNHGWKGLLITLALLAAAVAVLWLVGRVPVSDRSLLWFTLGLCVLLRLGYLLAVRTPPSSDFLELYTAARQTAAGDLSWAAENGYFYRWGYQIPFVLYEALVLKLVPSVWALKAMNLVFMTAIDALIYLIGRRFLPRRCALSVALLYAVYPASIHMVSVLTNQHIASFFHLLGLLLILSRQDWRWMLLAGACLSLGNLMRPEGPVFLAALGCCALYLLLRWPGKEGCRRLVLGVLAVVVAYQGVAWGVGGVLKSAGAAPYGLGNQVPEWTLVVGLDAEGSGTYSSRNEYILDIADSAQRRAESEKIIRESFARNSVPHFFLRKAKAMWGADESFFWSTGYLDGGEEKLPGVTVDRLITALELAEKAVYLLVWLGLAGAAVLLLRGEKEKSGIAFFCLVAVCGAFCAYQVIEVQARYRYFIMPMLFLSAGLPLRRLQGLPGKE